MTKPKNPPMPRRRSGRAAVLAGATLALALSAAPGAYADSGTGLLDDITDVVGQATQPVVQPIVQPIVEPVVQPVAQAVQSAVPQPVQEAVEPVVEQVVEPVRPLAQAVEQVAPSSEEPAGEQAGQPADGPADVPAETTAHGTVGHVAPGSAGAAGTDTVEPAENAVAQQATGGPSGGHGGDGSRHVDAPGPLATSCPDLPPRTGTTTVVALHGGDQAAASDQWTVWDVTNALMRLWAAGGGSPGEAVPPGQGDGDRRASGLPRPVPRAFPALDLPRPGAGPALGPAELVGLLGLLGVLATGVAGARARNRG